MSFNRKENRVRRQDRIRKKVAGTTERPRLSLCRSLNNLYAQIIDDGEGKTLLGLSSLSKDFSDKKDAGNVKGAKELGKLVAQKAIAKNIKKVVFDRAGFFYHGRVKAFAEGAREGGLEF